jgi:hypothetical protein
MDSTLVQIGTPLFTSQEGTTVVGYTPTATGQGVDRRDSDFGVVWFSVRVS